MHMKRRERVRNADKARNSFVTRRAEIKLNALAGAFKLAAGERWEETRSGTLRRELFFSGFQHLESLRLIYNWENRFMAVNYNLQMESFIPTKRPQFEEVHDCAFSLKCTQRGMKGERQYTWNCSRWSADDGMLAAYQERLTNPLITQRLDALDIFEMEIRHKDGSDVWQISCESLIGSATWILIPPILSVIMPKQEECIKIMELFELLGDAAANNR